MRHRLRNLPKKMKAPLQPIMRPPHNWKYATWGMCSGFDGILTVTGVACLSGCELLIGSFGASAVLLFGATESPLAQPRNLVGGQFLSAVVGAAIATSGGVGPIWMAVAVGLSILLMHVTHTTHPPGGATALIGVHDHAGWLFPLLPVAAGAIVLLVVALLTNNIANHRQYPKHWW